MEARTGLDRLGRTGSVWDGSAGAPIAALLRRYSRRMSVLEEALLDCRQAVDHWLGGLERRQSQVLDIVAAVAEPAGDPEAQDRRTRLIATARELSILVPVPGHEQAVMVTLSTPCLATSRP